MMPAADRAASSVPHAYPRLRRFAVDVAITEVFNVVIALIVTYVLGAKGFYEALVISLCIGTLMVTFIDGSRLLLWGTNKPPYLPFTLIFLVSVPAGLFLGNLLASAILGISAYEIELLQRALVAADRPAAFYLVLALGAAIITWFFWSQGHLENLKVEAEAEKARAAATEKQAMQAQLQLLQAQIEPHMLFNTLANLKGLISMDPTLAQQMLDQLIRYLRATLTTARGQTTALAQEFMLLDAFLGLMKVRMGTRLNYELHLPDDLASVPVPPMLLQPLVENAIKHGLEPKVEGGELIVRAERLDHHLQLTVSDTGLGFDAVPDTAGGGVGLSNVRERLTALFGEQGHLEIAPNLPAGTRVTITLPL